MDKPEALRLAEALDRQYLHAYKHAAAELRRLHAENERLHQINQSHEMKLSVRGYEIQIADLEAQRDALLEALKFYAFTMGRRKSDNEPFYMSALDLDCGDRARAAIKKAEGEKT